MSSAVGIANVMFLAALVAFAICAVACFAANESMDRVDNTADPRRARATAVTFATIGNAGLVVFAFEIVLRAGRALWGSMYEFTAIMGLIVMCLVAYWLLPSTQTSTTSGVLALVVVALMSIVRITAFTTPGDLQPALQSGWLTVHVMMAVIGASLLLTAGVVSALYLVRIRSDNAQASQTFPPDIDLTSQLSSPVSTAVLNRVEPDAKSRVRLGLRLAPSRSLDDTARRIVTVAFPIWTLAVILGAIWGEQAWGRYWGWDPKETTSFMVWAIFAAYLHARATATWKGKRAAIVATVGAGLILFNLFGINFLVDGLHSYAGG